jgi:hypothetical protein
MTFLLLVVGIAVYAKKDEAGSYIESGWMAASPDVQGGLQQLFDCCGLRTYNDSYANKAQCPVGPNIEPRACGPVLTDDFYKQFNTVGTTGIVFAVLMVPPPPRAVGPLFSLPGMWSWQPDCVHDVCVLPDSRHSREEHESGCRRSEPGRRLRQPLWPRLAGYVLHSPPSPLLALPSLSRPPLSPT